jgi:hypothetical protein
MAGQVTLEAVASHGLVRPASAPPPVDDRTLPVPESLRILLPARGLRRGSTVAVMAGWPAVSGGTSLVLALLAEASRSGSWCAVVGIPAFGAVAAADVGIALDRLALVPHPGPEWATVVAALVDGVDVVVIAVPGTVSASITGRLAARARQRGCVLVPYGRWEGADLTLRVTRGHWEGLSSAGHGRLRRREVTILAQGRGAATQPKEITVWMPGTDGRVAVASIVETAPTAEPPSRPRLALVQPGGVMTARRRSPARPSAALAGMPGEGAS